MSDWLTITRGDAPLIISVPHAGTHIPKDILPALRDRELAISDADFYVDKLYQFAIQHAVTIITTQISRTVIDVNRDPAGVSLYPGQATTGLCPTERFDGTALYHEGCDPGEAEIARRRAAYFNPYHAALHAEIERLRASHTKIVLYDAHSILSRVPRLFPGELMQFNIGSFEGKSCAPALTESVSAACSDSQIVNGRFKGGWITRHYGAQERGIHAIQMELAMRGYLDEAGEWPPRWDAERAELLHPMLRNIITACLNFAKD